jgi:hypothetical protein
MVSSPLNFSLETSRLSISGLFAIASATQGTAEFRKRPRTWIFLIFLRGPREGQVEEKEFEIMQISDSHGREAKVWMVESVRRSGSE